MWVVVVVEALQLCICIALYSSSHCLLIICVKNIGSQVWGNRVPAWGQKKTSGGSRGTAATSASGGPERKDSAAGPVEPSLGWLGKLSATREGPAPAQPGGLNTYLTVAGEGRFICADDYCNFNMFNSL